MSYLVPSEFVTKMIDAGESKIFMSTRDTIVRAYMAGAILALAAWFAITTPLAFCHGPLPIRSPAFTAGAPAAAVVLRYACHIWPPAPAAVARS